MMLLKIKIKYYLKELWTLLKISFLEWYKRQPFRNSTVISYYTIFSLPGLGVIIINLGGIFYGPEAITNRISVQIRDVIGPSAADTVERIIANAYTSEGLTLSSLLSIGILFFGATGVFYQVQQSLNVMWGVESRPKREILKFLKDRLFSFGMILIIGFLLLVSLVISALINAFSSWISVSIFGLVEMMLKTMDTIFSLFIITFLFAAIYKILPDVKIQWKDVWTGAFAASFLFTIAKYFLGLYFGMSQPGSVYGAAGSIILLMLWTTYSALILLFGAEFTRIYALRYEKKIEPATHAEFINRQEIEQNKNNNL